MSKRYIPSTISTDTASMCVAQYHKTHVLWNLGIDTCIVLQQISQRVACYRANMMRLTAASTLAGLSSLGSASMDITEIRIVSTVWTGSHLSDAFS